MNIAQANKIVTGLIEEESLDEYKTVIRSFYNDAQQQISTTVDFIEGEFQIICAYSSEIDIREYIENHYSKKIYMLRRILSDSSFEKILGYKYHFEKGIYKIYCYVYPEIIDDTTSLDYEFEVSPEAISAITYFAAAQCKINDPDQRAYYALLDRYNNILQNMNDSKRKSTSINIVKLGGNINGI